MIDEIHFFDANETSGEVFWVWYIKPTINSFDIGKSSFNLLIMKYIDLNRIILHLIGLESSCKTGSNDLYNKFYKIFIIIIIYIIYY